MTGPIQPFQEQDEPIRARLRRRFLSQYGMGSEDPMDPVSRISPEAPRMGSGLYRESEIGNAAIDRSPETARRQGRGQAIIDAAIAGLSGLDPKQGGVGGFLGSAAQAAGRVRGVYGGLTQEEPEQTGVPDQLLRYAFAEEPALSEFEQYKADPAGYAAFKAAGRAPEAPTKPPGLIEVAPGGRLVDPTTHKAVFTAPDRPKEEKSADKKLEFGVAGGIEAIKGILEHYKADPTSIRTPVGALWAESLAGVHVPGFGSPFEGLAESSRQHAMTPGQSEVADLYEAVAHNIAGLLPNKGLAIFKSLRDVYRSKAGSSPETDRFKITLLERLQRRLEQLQRGEKVTDADFESDLNDATGASHTPPPMNTTPKQEPPSVVAPHATDRLPPDPRKFYKPRSTP